MARARAGLLHRGRPALHPGAWVFYKHLATQPGFRAAWALRRTCWQWGLLQLAITVPLALPCMWNSL